MLSALLSRISAAAARPVVSTEHHRPADRPQRRDRSLPPSSCPQTTCAAQRTCLASRKSLINQSISTNKYTSRVIPRERERAERERERESDRKVAIMSYSSSRGQGRGRGRGRGRGGASSSSYPPPPSSRERYDDRRGAADRHDDRYSARHDDGLRSGGGGGVGNSGGMGRGASLDRGLDRGLGGGSGRGRGRGSDINKPAWMTSAANGGAANGGAGRGVPSAPSSGDAARAAAAAMVRSVVAGSGAASSGASGGASGGGNSASASMDRGRGRGRGRGADLRPAWMTRGGSDGIVAAGDGPSSGETRSSSADAGRGRGGRGTTRPSSSSSSSKGPAASDNRNSAAASSDSRQSAARQRFHTDLSTLSSQIRAEERRRLDDEQRRLLEGERLRKQEEEVRRKEDQRKREEEVRRLKEEEERKRREEEEALEREELRRLEELAGGLVATAGDDGEGIMFEDEEEREARLARERREKRRKRLEEVATREVEEDGGVVAKRAKVDEADATAVADEKKEDVPMEMVDAAPPAAGGTATTGAVEDSTPNGGNDGGTDSFDMFASSPSPASAAAKGSTNNNQTTNKSTADLKTAGIGEATGGLAGLTRASADAADAGNYDDAEGYYRAAIGEIVTLAPPTSEGGETNGGNTSVNLRVLGIIGKGVFSTVLKAVPAEDSEQKNVLAMKLIRSNETMAKAAVKEVRILRLLCGSKSSRKSNSSSDNGNSEAEEIARNHNIVRLLEITTNGIDFEGRASMRIQQQQSATSLPPLEYRNHTTLLFEHLPYNLRETLAKFGKNVGINLTAVRSYSRQLFRALAHLAKHRVVHADIKPDNILVSADFSTVKLCDFGSAFFETDSDNVPTPYLVSRFYRAPEIILGLDYDRAVDLWSVAATLSELFTGSVLFPGRTNNDMLRRFVDTMGPFSNKILRRHCSSYGRMGLAAHYEAVPGGSYSFRRQEVDKVTGRPVVKIIPKVEASPSKQIARILLKSRSSSDDRADVLRFADLLGRCLALDPARRLGVREAWDHDFFSNKKKHKQKADEVKGGGGE